MLFRCTKSNHRLMQLIKKLFLGFSIGLMPIFLFGQGTSDTSVCYTDSIKSGNDKVFHVIQTNASFKRGNYYFKDFLIKYINHNKFIKELSKIQPSYSDTARVKFIISKHAIMSNLQIKGTKHEDFKSEIEKVLKQSSCFWFPGEYSGRKVDGWYQYDIFYFVELKNGEVNITLNNKEYSRADYD